MFTLDVRATIFEKDNLRGLATVSFGSDVKLNGIRIMEGKEGKLFVSLPSFKAGDGTYKEYFHPITKEFKEKFDEQILGAYQNALDGIKHTSKAEGDVTISNVRATEFKKDNLRGLATVVLDDSFVLQNIKIMRGEHGLFASMPSYKGADGNYHSYVELGNEFKKTLNAKVVDALKAPDKKPIQGEEKKPELDVAKKETAAKKKTAAKKTGVDAPKQQAVKTPAPAR